MTTTPQAARSRLLLLVVTGVALLAGGAVLFFAQFPHTQTGGCFAYAPTEGGIPCAVGSLRLSLLGAAIAGAGFLVVLVPIIAWAVPLGLLAGRRNSDA